MTCARFIPSPLPASSLPKRPFSFLSTHSCLIHGESFKIILEFHSLFKVHLCHWMFSLAKGRASYIPAVWRALPYGLQPQTLPSGPVSFPIDILHSVARARSSQLPLRANQRLPTEPKVLPARSSPTHPVLLPCLWPLPALSSSLTLPPRYTGHFLLTRQEG